MPSFCPLCPPRSHLSFSGGWGLRILLPSSYLVMPFMQTDLQKLMGMEFSEDKVQYLVYQMLKGLKVGRGGGRGAGVEAVASPSPPLSLSPLQYIHSAGVVHRVSVVSARVLGCGGRGSRNRVLCWPRNWEQQGELRFSGAWAVDLSALR